MIFIYLLFFLEYTYARSPFEYCNNIESPPPYLIFLDKNGTFQFLLNLEYNQSPAHPSSVNEDNHFNIIKETAYSSAVDQGKVN